MAPLARVPERERLGEEVRASVNVAYLAQTVADCSSILYPIWKTGLPDLERLTAMISSGIAIVMEGGAASVRDPASFAGAKCSHADLVHVTERILLSAVLDCQGLARDSGYKALHAPRRAILYIRSVGQTLRVRKRRRVGAGGRNHKEFAVAENEFASGIPDLLVTAHGVTADPREGVLFANWAYRMIHDALIPIRHVVANGALAWLIRLPDAVEMPCSTTEACAVVLRMVGMRPAPTYQELELDDRARLFARLLYAGMQEWGAHACR